MRKLNGIFLMLYYEAVSTSLLPVTRSRGSTKPPLFPPELSENDLYRLKIPNKRFCDEMETKFEGRYLVVPWLYQNCQDLKDVIAKNLSDSVALPIHKAVLEKIKSYKRSGLLKYNSKTKIPPMIAIISQLTNVYPRKKHKMKSSESIENILYYKGCNHKKPTETTMLRGAPQQQECKMCCTMCCGDQCVNNNQMISGRQAQGVNIEPKVLPILPGMQQRDKRKKIKPIPIQPLPNRRGLSFTRENIKSLISSDGDIRKILKDLVRVTMQKVDLMQLIKDNNIVKTQPEPSADYSDSANDL